MTTKTETVNNALAQLEDFIRTFYLEIGLAGCFIAGTMTEFQCYVAGLYPIWGLLWGLPMAALVLFYHKK